MCEMTRETSVGGGGSTDHDQKQQERQKDHHSEDIWDEGRWALVCHTERVLQQTTVSQYTGNCVLDTTSLEITSIYTSKLQHLSFPTICMCYGTIWDNP